MKETKRNKISILKGAAPIKSCPSGHWPMSRPRFYWMRKPVEKGKGVRIVADTNYYIMEFLSESLPIQPFLGQKYKVHENFTTFPTFVQSRARKSPPILPAGINSMDSAALQRWRADEHRFAPYQYAFEKLVQDKKRGNWSPPSTRTRRGVAGLSTRAHRSRGDRSWAEGRRQEEHAPQRHPLGAEHSLRYAAIAHGLATARLGVAV